MADIDQEELEHLREQVAHAIRQMRDEIRWKPGKDIEHLQTRIGYGHLPTKADLGDYESIISAILHEPMADVYVFMWQDDAYPTVVAEHSGERWLMMFSLSGIMETAFPPTDPDTYLADPRFRYLDTLQELLS